MKLKDFIKDDPDYEPAMYQDGDKIITRLEVDFKFKVGNVLNFYHKHYWLTSIFFPHDSAFVAYEVPA